MHRRLGAAVALSAALLLGACTNDAPQPPPPPSDGPAVPSASPTASHPPTSASPENRKHADLLRIQDLYKAEFADEIRVLKHGGADELPPSIRKRTTGTYQKDILETFRQEKKNGTRMTVGGKLLGIAMGPWRPSKVTFRSCEDYSGLKSVYQNGKPVRRKPGVRAIQKITVVKDGRAWLISAADASVVEDFHGAPCNGKWYS